MENLGHIFIDEEITPATLDYVKKRLVDLSGKDSLVLHIASPGGSVYAGYNIYHALKAANKPIKTIIEGEAQSMATFIAMAGDTIEICNPSVYMIHNPSNGIQGTAEDFERGASELRNIESDMVSIYAAKTKLSEEEIRKMMSKQTVMNADQAVKYGFADKKLTNYMVAVAKGKKIMKSEEKNILQKIAGIFAKASGEPVMMDYKTQDGKVLQISDDGTMATIDGQPASGTFTLEDGKTVVVENGAVVSITDPAQSSATPPPAPAQAPPAPAPAPTQSAEQQLAAAQAEIQKIKAEKEALEKLKAEADQKAATTATALGDAKKEFEKLKALTAVGDPEPPAKQTKQPSAMGPTAQQREETMNFLMEHMPWLQNYYSEDKIAKYVRGPKAASILETNFSYTYPGILTTEVFYKPSLGNPALTDLFTIDQGIKNNKRYNLINPISKILKPYTGCDRTFNNNQSFITDTNVQVKEFQVSESWCKDDFTDQLTGAYNYLAQEWLKTGVDSFDPSGTPIQRIIDTVLSNALRIDVFRRVSFAAGNSSDVDYNQFDGLWDRLIDSSGASNYCVVRAGSALGTGTLASGAALTALEAVYANSNILLKDWDNIYAQFGGQVQKPTFWVTRSVWDNYYNSLIGTGAVTEQAFENLQKGLTTLTYKGYPVRPISLWDQFLAESDNPLFATTRHLILFTTKDNHILGVEQGSDLNKIDGWYERKDRKFYYEADMKMGYNYLHCDLQTIAY